VVARVMVGKVKLKAEGISSSLSGPSENKFANVSKIRHHSSHWPSKQKKIKEWERMG
jgi:hypothetical protein